VIRNIVKWGLRKVPLGLVRPILAIWAWTFRERVARGAWEASRGKVVGGPFSGLEIPIETRWSGAQSTFAKLQGNYESFFLEGLTSRKWGVFIDVGCADGYYMKGMLESGFCHRAIGFEIDAEARDQATSNLQDHCGRFELLGGANEASLSRILDQEKSLIDGKPDGLILMDIEGAEYELILSVLTGLQDWSVAVEFHDLDDNRENLRAVTEGLSKSHNLSWSADHQQPLWTQDLRLSGAAWMTEDEFGIALGTGRTKPQLFLLATPK